MGETLAAVNPKSTGPETLTSPLWICPAVAVPVHPEYVVLTVNIFVSVLNTRVEEPVAVEALGVGLSLAPLNVALKVGSTATFTTVDVVTAPALSVAFAVITYLPSATFVQVNE